MPVERNGIIGHDTEALLETYAYAPYCAQQIWEAFQIISYYKNLVFRVRYAY